MTSSAASGSARCGGALMLGLGLVALACGAPAFEVPTYPHPEGAPAEPVLFMPPPAQIEHIGAEPPAKGCLWADGQWVWSAQRWEWRPGSWLRPPEGCRYSAPALEWAPGGKSGILYYRPGRWYSVSEPAHCPAPVICPSQSPAPLNAEATTGS
jgi:hypothetical protein